MKVAQWTVTVTDEDIFEMLFHGSIKDFECPHCNKDSETDPNTIIIKCDCGEEYYSPIYDPALDI